MFLTYRILKVSKSKSMAIYQNEMSAFNYIDIHYKKITK